MADNEPIDVVHSREHHDSTQCKREQHQDAQKCDDMEAKYKEGVIPEGGYGWVCVASVFWLNAHTWGINSVSLLFAAVIVKGNAINS
ncbi:transporter [Aspergillus sclerotialis]|uniref:Transporter n=1 Tax=Aspergillus sclerotialis TaxID=2070753 RepID=A0A3A2ZMG2_9EURO|nr:transporter [Aspergillus sclerotialis]